MRYGTAYAFCLVLMTGLHVSAAAHAACRLIKGEQVEIISTEGGALMLKDGRVVKLANVELPPASLAALDRLVAQRSFILGYSGKRSDRHGRLVAYPLLQKRSYLQLRLVKAGFARVSISRDNRACVPELLAAENQARQARRGLWADSSFAIRQAEDVDELKTLEGTYQLVEGVVRDARIIRGRIFVNFGMETKRDFTMTVAPGDARLFTRDLWQRAGTEFPHLQGARIRIRGWIGFYNGPEIVVTMPEQVELLDAGAAKGQ